MIFCRNPRQETFSPTPPSSKPKFNNHGGARTKRLVQSSPVLSTQGYERPHTVAECRAGQNVYSPDTQMELELCSKISEISEADFQKYIFFLLLLLFVIQSHLVSLQLYKDT